MTSRADELRAQIAGLSEERKLQMLARLRREQEARRTAWLCANIACLGTAHAGYPVPHARPTQRLPFKAGDGKIGGLWLAGRGFGKTRVGAEGVRDRVDRKLAKRVALIGRTSADVRDVMVEGESGLLSVFPRWQRPQYQPSKRRVVFHTGAQAFCYSSDEPDLLRGPQHDFLWGDEVSTWKRLDDVLSNAFLGLRLGDDPRCILTGTPRPTKDMRKLVKNTKLTIIRGSTYDNLSNLAGVFRDLVVSQYEGTRIGRQELNGEMLDDIEGALLAYSEFEWDGFRDAPELDTPGRVADPRVLTRVVVSVDPAVTSETKSDHTGITVMGIDGQRANARTGYVLWSERFKGTPAQSMERVAVLYDEYMANKVVAEVNNGGDYVGTVLHQIRPDITFGKVHASKGKVTRAEPVAGLYEKRRMRHVGHPSIHAALEGEWTTWTPDDDDSPDVLDSCVWAATDLMLSAGAREIAPAKSIPA